ncbi:hypothetical protein [Ferrimonas balearica]|uniref:hypothetical protein n=1 Tax=Ferrimonas balearica TaxID=44012 RepID=UPI001C992A98|nr:hypothetical protein [Ferrimonas balearica]MBY5993920.1 hypothetical protein [Ferrimonas balearica]
MKKREKALRYDLIRQMLAQRNRLTGLAQRLADQPDAAAHAGEAAKACDIMAEKLIINPTLEPIELAYGLLGATEQALADGLERVNGGIQ